MLILYVRHTQLCLKGDGKKPGLLSKGLSREKLNAWKHCDCPKWYSGSLNGKRHPRTSLKCTSWDVAEKALAKIKEGETPEAGGVSVEKAILAWLEEATLNGAADTTLHQRTGVGRKLIAFCQRQRIRYAQQIDPALINRLRAEWCHEQTNRRATPGVAPGTARIRVSILKLFFKFCCRMRWIKENPMALIKFAFPSEDGSEETTQTLPLDDEGDRNYQKLLKAIPVFLASRRKNGGALNSRPDHLVALVELMYETGLRVSDALFFIPGQIEVDPADGWGSYTTKQRKTRKMGKRSLVTVTIPPELTHRLLALKPIAAPYLFWDGKMNYLYFYVVNVWPILHGAGNLAGIEGMRAHRLRDSFAVNRLNEGMLIQDVSKLLGHSSVTVTERYYAPFVKSRKDALMAKRKAAYSSTPGQKVVSIGKRRAG